jgi:acyl carrier protein
MLNADDTRRILQSVAAGVNWSAVEEDASLSEAGLDSLDKATFFLNVEEAVGTSIPDSAYENIDSIRSLLEYLRSSQAAA